MARKPLDFTTIQPDGRVGELAPQAFHKIDDMMAELYASWTSGKNKILSTDSNGSPIFNTALAFGLSLLNTSNEDGVIALLKGTTTGKALLQATDVNSARSHLSARAIGNIASYLVNDTFVVPSGCKMIRVLVIGGGGGGSGALSGNAGGGGGGGGVAIKTIYNPTVGQSIAITIGAGGSAGVKSQGDGGAGGNGGTSSFGSYCSATGGTSLGYGQAGNSGMGVGGDINLGSGPGGLGGVRGTDTSRYMGGNGGGFGGPSGIYSSNGSNASARGCGGAGGGIGPESAPDGSTGTRNGGQGSAGLILLEWM